MWKSVICKKPFLNRGVATIVTPGQGIVSQESIDFIKPYLDIPRVKELISQADDITQLPISSIFQGGGKLEVQKTSVQQPLIILQNSIQKTVLEDIYDIDLYSNNKVKYCVGHSVGEITNLVLQNCISFQDGIDIAHKRGLLMENQLRALDNYKMFALIVDRKSFDLFLSDLKRYDDKISISNINSDEQLVISGIETDCLQVLEEMSTRFKIRKKIDLQVSIPFHSKVLTPIVDELYLMFLNTELNKWLKFESILNLDGSKNKLTTDYISKILLVTGQTVNFKKCIDTLVEDEEECIFINYSPVTKNMIDRYLKTQKKKFQSYCLDNDQNIKQLSSFI